MSFTVWLTVRRARQALKAGQPETAQGLIAPYVTQGHRSAVRAAREVAEGFGRRGEKFHTDGNPDAAWRDLLAGEALAPEAEGLRELRTALVQLSLAECRGALIGGNPVRALESIARFRQRPAHHPFCDEYEEACRAWLLAADAADRGDFSVAVSTITAGRDGLPADATAGLDAFLADLHRRADRYRSAVEESHAASELQNWPSLLQAADEILAVAPNHREARNLKARAWEKLQPGSGQMPALRFEGPRASQVVELAWGAAGGGAVVAATKTYAGEANGQPIAAPVPIATSTFPKRFVLWIDGVGGYLVCLAPRVTFGQATTQGPVDVPLFADVSRLHAELSRDGEGYVLESARDVTVNGQPSKRTVLKSGDRVTLGGTCQFVFHRPVAISPTARLELVSGHRLPVAVDGVILMAENLIFGPGGDVHIPAPDAAGNVIFYRSKDGIGLRFPGRFKIDNRPCDDRGELPVPCSVVSDSFSFAVEAIGPRV